MKVVTQSSDGKTNTFYHTVGSGSSFGGNSLQLEMGLGDALLIKEIEITWPSLKSNKTKLKDVAINQILGIVENS